MRSWRVSIVAVLATAALAVAACNGTGSTPTPAASTAPAATTAPAASTAGSTSPAASESSAPAQLTGTLRIGANAFIISKFPLQAAANDFMAKHPGVTVTISANDQTDFVQKYLLDWSSGHTDVDLALGGTEGQLAPLAAKGLLVPWDDFFTGNFTKDKFIAPFLNLGVFGGHQLTLPFLGEVMMFSINKPLFAKAGLLDKNTGEAIAPATWKDLETYATKLTAANGGVPGLSVHWGFSFAAYDYFTCLLGEQGTIYGADGKTVDFSSAAAHDCLTVGRDMIAAGTAMKDTTANDDAARTAFKAGTIGAILEAASRETEGANTLGSNNVGLMWAPGTQKNGTIAFTHAAFIPKISPAINLAKAFVQEEVLSDAFEQSGLQQFGKLPVMQSAYGFTSNATVQLQLSAAEHAVNAPRYRDYNQLDTLMQQEIQKAVLGRETVDAALANLQSGIGKLDLTNVSQ
jgi:ABC-type glycerol-3-phosphate transport system substrate-binding protein